MKSLFSACAVLFLTVASAAAQVVTPFTPRLTDADGNRVYVQPGKKVLPKMAVTFGYGFLPVTSFDSYMNERFPYRDNSVANPNPNHPQGEITGTTGPITVGFSYEFMPWLELNVPFYYQHNAGRQHKVAMSNSQWGSSTDDLFGILPNVRINWLRNDWLSLYSRAGIGLGFGKRWVSLDQDDTSKAMFGFQFSPVGIELGAGRFCFFAEGGWGYTGAVSAGIKLKVGKVTKEGKTSTGRKVNWYDKHLN